MQKLLLAVDRRSTGFGKACAWSVVGLTLLITWEVFSRYVLNKPHAWVLDAQIMLYGVLFMTAGAYTLAKSGKTQAQIHDDTDRDKILGAEEAVAYGLVDQVMQRRKPTVVQG